jgi:serine/threonine-protein kinase
MARVIKLAHTWTLAKKRGGGGFGTVYEATNETGDQAAVKLVLKKAGADRETLIATDVTGLPKVVPILDSGEDRSDYVLVMPLADRSLEDEVAARGGSIPVDEAVPIFADIAEALEAVHGKGIVHRDLKPPNALLIEGQWKLSDFGIARYAEATTAAHTFKFMGTMAYMAPERWVGERAREPSDIYSFGVTAFEILTGSPPFAGPDEADFADQHRHQAPSSPAGVPPSLASLILECLDKASEARPTAANILHRLRRMGGPASAGSAALQAANAARAAANADASAKLSTARDAHERRVLLVSSATDRLRQIAATIQERIDEDAPLASNSTVRTRTSGWSRSLGPATIWMDEILPAPEDAWGGYPPAFEVIAHSAIGVRIPQNRHGWEGRAHSLWFCDAKEAGVFRWFETAFMIMPLINKMSTVDPFSLPPGADAGVGIAPVIGNIQVAWPFLPFDQGDDAEFIDRWLEWFAAASQGQLSKPSSMPERSDAQGSWRRG